MRKCSWALVDMGLVVVEGGKGRGVGKGGGGWAGGL